MLEASAKHGGKRVVMFYRFDYQRLIRLVPFSLAFWKDTIVFVIISLLIARNVSSIVL